MGRLAEGQGLKAAKTYWTRYDTSASLSHSLLVSGGLRDGMSDIGVQHDQGATLVIFRMTGVE